MDLGHCEYAFGNRKTTHYQLEGRDTIHSRSGGGKKLENSRNRLDSRNLHHGKAHMGYRSLRIVFFF
jgi:hypothetical protein